MQDIKSRLLSRGKPSPKHIVIISYDLVQKMQDYEKQYAPCLALLQQMTGLSCFNAWQGKSQGTAVDSACVTAAAVLGVMVTSATS